MSALLTSWSRDTFRHEALLYAGSREFIEATTAFIREALDDDEPVLVVVEANKIDSLRDALGDQAEEIDFADMHLVGQNPARLIPVWRNFADKASETGRPFRGISEPVTPSRTSDEVVECQRHEDLLNLAFADSRPWWLVCPYDIKALPSTVVEAACEAHPVVSDGRESRPNSSFQATRPVRTSFDVRLPSPPPEAATLTFSAPGSLAEVREFTETHARSIGLDRARTGELVLAVNELATNSLRHGGGEGALRVWEHDGAIVAQVSDDGWIPDPLAGRQLPAAEGVGGRGLWLVNQLCDLVQIRSSKQGTTVRVHLRLGDDG